MGNNYPRVGGASRSRYRGRYRGRGWGRCFILSREFRGGCLKFFLLFSARSFICGPGWGGFLTSWLRRGPGAGPTDYVFVLRPTVDTGANGDIFFFGIRL